MLIGFKVSMPFNFLCFCRTPKKGASTSITFSHGTKRAKRGGEGGSGGKKRIYTKDSLKMFPFYASTSITKVLVTQSNSMELFLWFQKSHLAPK